MKKRPNRGAEAFSRMTTAVLKAATTEFDREMVRNSFRSLSPKAKANWRMARQKPGRPRQGEGAKMISVTWKKVFLRSRTLSRRTWASRARA